MGSTSAEMAFKMRSTKFRHVYGSPYRKEQCFENVRITRNAHDSNFCAVNPKSIAVVTESAGGGTFVVLPTDRPGRVDINQPKVCGHSGAIMDIKWSPFNDDIIASCSDDSSIKIWEIPNGGLHSNLSDWSVDLHGHTRKVTYMDWHPTVENILLSAGLDYKCVVWNVEQAEPVNIIECHNDTIFSLSWNNDGSLFSTTCKDKHLRVIDPRMATVAVEAEGHGGAKPSKCVFMKDNRHIFTAGFSRSSDRQYALWDVRKMNSYLVRNTIDYDSGILLPYYDPDLNIIYLAGKGNGNIRYYEIASEEPYIHFLNAYQSSTPQRSLGMMPKRGCDVSKCEVLRFYKLHAAKNLIEPISMICPRKSDKFQEDIYPPTRGTIPSLLPDEWITGQNRDPILVSVAESALNAAPTITTYKAVNKQNQDNQKSAPKRANTIATDTFTHNNNTTTEPASIRNIKRLSTNEDFVSIRASDSQQIQQQKQQRPQQQPPKNKGEPVRSYEHQHPEQPPNLQTQSEPEDSRSSFMQIKETVKRSLEVKPTEPAPTTVYEKERERIRSLKKQAQQRRKGDAENYNPEEELNPSFNQAKRYVQKHASSETARPKSMVDMDTSKLEEELAAFQQASVPKHPQSQPALQRQRSLEKDYSSEPMTYSQQKRFEKPSMSVYQKTSISQEPHHEKPSVSVYQQSSRHQEPVYQQSSRQQEPHQDKPSVSVYQQSSRHQEPVYQQTSRHQEPVYQQTSRHQEPVYRHQEPQQEKPVSVYQQSSRHQEPVYQQPSRHQDPHQESTVSPFPITRRSYEPPPSPEEVRRRPPKAGSSSPFSQRREFRPTEIPSPIDEHSDIKKFTHNRPSYPKLKQETIVTAKPFVPFDVQSPPGEKRREPTYSQPHRVSEKASQPMSTYHQNSLDREEEDEMLPNFSQAKRNFEGKEESPDYKPRVSKQGSLSPFAKRREVRSSEIPSKEKTEYISPFSNRASYPQGNQDNITARPFVPFEEQQTSQDFRQQSKSQQVNTQPTTPQYLHDNYQDSFMKKDKIRTFDYQPVQKVEPYKPFSDNRRGSSDKHDINLRNKEVSSSPTTDIIDKSPSYTNYNRSSFPPVSTKRFDAVTAQTYENDGDIAAWEEEALRNEDSTVDMNTGRSGQLIDQIAFLMNKDDSLRVKEEQLRERLERRHSNTSQKDMSSNLRKNSSLTDIRSSPILKTPEFSPDILTPEQQYFRPVLEAEEEDNDSLADTIHEELDSEVGDFTERKALFENKSPSPVESPSGPARVEKRVWSPTSPVYKEPPSSNGITSDSDKIHVRKMWQQPQSKSHDDHNAPNTDAELKKAYFRQQDEIRQLQEQINLKDKRIRQLEEELKGVRETSCGPGESNC